MPLGRHVQRSLAAISCLVGATTATCAQLAPEPLGVLVAAGDFMSCGGQSKDNAHDNAIGMMREIEAAQSRTIPVAVLLLGDLAYEDGSQHAFDCFRDTVLEQLHVPGFDAAKNIMPTPGNHDLETSSGKWFYTLFSENQWIGDDTPGDNKGYYSAIFPESAQGAWHLFAINSQINAAVDGSQYSWLKQSLEHAPERCLLTFWHAPVFSSGHHGHDESEDFAQGQPVKQTKMSPVFELFHTAQGSVVVNGHDHDFESVVPHNAEGVADSKGVKAFVVGTGGKKLYREYEKKLSINEHFDSQNYGFLKLELFPDHYKWQFIKSGEAGEPLFSGQQDCNPRT